MKILIRIAAFFLIATYIFFSCKKDKVVVSVPPAVNKPPIANAGTDQTITLPVDSVLLNGNASFDPDGTIVSYLWIKVSGPSSSAIIKGDTSKTLVKNLVMGIYKFELTITDNGGLSAKDTLQVIVAPINQPPTARAGADVTLTLTSCGIQIAGDLDGSGSTDPDNNIISYTWRKISGPGANVRNSSFRKASVELSQVGEYAFELSIRDAGNLTSKDTMLISVKGNAKEHDLDITFNGTFSFFNNEKDCYYYTPCSYYDASIIEGKATFLPIGEFNLYFSEYADTAASRYADNSYISLYRTNLNIGIWGNSSVNLKKLFQQGGGPFSGTFIVEGGSASNCDPDIYKNLAPLNITGSIDTAAHKAIIRIYGKTYF